MKRIEKSGKVERAKLLHFFVLGVDFLRCVCYSSIIKKFNIEVQQGTNFKPWKVETAPTANT